MTRQPRKAFLAIFCIAMLRLAATPAAAAEPDLSPYIDAVNRVGVRGAGHAEAIPAWKQLAAVDASRLPEVLAGMDDSGTLAANWMRGAVEAIAQRAGDAGIGLPIEGLQQFIEDRTHAPHARRLAYELVVQARPELRQSWLPRLLDDPSLELRRDGVAYALQQAAATLEAGQQAEAVAAYRRALTFARDRDQADAAAKQLEALGQQVDLAKHFGFIRKWKLIAPFDNVGMKGFDVAYGPEIRLDPNGSYEGKAGTVRWVERETEDPYGLVDLNQALSRYKGAIAYAYAEFTADQARDAEFRLGCINANKVWLNGDLLTANEVYHSGSYMDQYVAQGRLKAGRNVILLKIAQNEQTDSWAQRWEFQFRVCDQYGTAILSQDRGS
jgi:hypothetical protein